jgi:hypothetical protein
VLNASSNDAAWTAPSDALHHPADRRQVGRPHHASVTQGITVSVFKVGDCLVSLVANERNCSRVAPKGRARQAQSLRRLAQGLLQRRAPGAILATMVNLVEHDECATGELPPR